MVRRAWTFLPKFNNIARYLEWTDEDAKYNLCGSLEGAAGQVLWDIGPHATTGDVIQLLQTRFGTLQLQESMVERFKACRAIRARRRRQGETLQTLYQDITRLVSLAYPSARVTLTNHVGKEAFNAALNDGHLQLEVMK